MNCFQLHHTQVTYIESRKSSLCENEFEIYVEVEVTPSICSLATLVETLKSKVHSINLIRTYNQIDKLKKFTSLDRGDTKCKNNLFCDNTLKYFRSILPYHKHIDLLVCNRIRRFCSAMLVMHKVSIDGWLIDAFNNYKSIGQKQSRSIRLEVSLNRLRWISSPKIRAFTPDANDIIQLQ